MLDLDRPLGLVDEQKPAGCKAPAVDVKVDGVVRRAVEIDDCAGTESNSFRERQRRAAELCAETHADVADRCGREDRFRAVDELAAALLRDAVGERAGHADDERVRNERLALHRQVR